MSVVFSLMLYVLCLPCLLVSTFTSPVAPDLTYEPKRPS